METDETEHQNDSTTNSEEKQSDSFNSSELDAAMNELLTQDGQESDDDCMIVTPEADLLDMMEEKSVPKIGIHKLKIHAALKILRRSKNLRKKNYYFIKGLGNASKNSPMKLKIATPESINSRFNIVNKADEKDSMVNIRNIGIESGKKASNAKKSLAINTSETLMRIDDKTSQKIKKVVTSGDLTIQRLKSSEYALEGKNENSLVMKGRAASPQNSSVQNVSSNELLDTNNPQKASSDRKMSLIKPVSTILAPGSFPKAIVYPDTKKLVVQPAKPTEALKMSFNEVFTKATEEKIKSKKSIDEKIAKTDSTISPKIRVRNPKSKESNCKKNSDAKIEPKPFKYLIPQDLLASPESKSGTSTSTGSHNNSVCEQQATEEKMDDSHSVIPERPQINYDLIDSLADYRVIARYLFNKLNIPPIDFDGTDDYINLYKLSRN